MGYYTDFGLLIGGPKESEEKFNTIIKLMYQREILEEETDFMYTISKDIQKKYIKDIVYFYLSDSYKHFEFFEKYLLILKDLCTKYNFGFLLIAHGEEPGDETQIDNKSESYEKGEDLVAKYNLYHKLYPVRDIIIDLTEDV